MCVGRAVARGATMGVARGVVMDVAGGVAVDRCVAGACICTQLCVDVFLQYFTLHHSDFR